MIKHSVVYGSSKYDGVKHAKISNCQKSGKNVDLNEIVINSDDNPNIGIKTFCLLFDIELPKCGSLSNKKYRELLHKLVSDTLNSVHENRKRSNSKIYEGDTDIKFDFENTFDEIKSVTKPCSIIDTAPKIQSLTSEVMKAFYIERGHIEEKNAPKKTYFKKPKSLNNKLLQPTKILTSEDSLIDRVFRRLQHHKPEELEGRQCITVANQLTNSDKTFGQTRENITSSENVKNCIIELGKTGKINLSKNCERFGLVVPEKIPFLFHNIEEKTREDIWNDYKTTLLKVTSFKAGVNNLINSCTHIRNFSGDKQALASNILKGFIEDGLLQ